MKIRDWSNLPEHEKGDLAEAQKVIAKESNEAKTCAIADKADQNSLREQHSAEFATTGTHGAQRCKMTRVFEHKGIEGLARDCCTNNKTDDDDCADVDGNACIFDIPHNG